MTEQQSTAELPVIPSDAPQWVHDMPSSGRFVDRTKLYDITGHLLFDSLLNLNGIRHFYYFVCPRKQSANVSNDSAAPPSNSVGTIEQVSDEVRVAFHLGEGICGHRGIVHGGLTATILDEVSGAAALLSIGPCFTANLNVDYKKPLLIPTWVLVRAYAERADGRKVYVRACVENGQGEVYAEATCLFIKPKAPVQELPEAK